MPDLSTDSDARLDVVPDLRPDLVGRLAERPRVFQPERVAPVGVVAEERQVGPPGHPHREAGAEHRPEHGREALRPSVRPSDPRRRPVDRQEIPSEVSCTLQDAGRAYRACFRLGAHRAGENIVGSETAGGTVVVYPPKHANNRISLAWAPTGPEPPRCEISPQRELTEGSSNDAEARNDHEERVSDHENS